MIRFVFYTVYPKGVSLGQGERWYLGEHVAAVKKVPGVRRYVSWRTIPPQDRIKKAVPQWPDDGWPVRRSDLYLDDYKHWEATRHLWVAAKEGQPGFGAMECIFLPIEMQYNLLRNCPPEHIKYITMPMIWRGPGGKPPDVEESEDYLVWSYLQGHDPAITDHEADDWYLGHHTREGKQLPGMKLYRTWKGIRVPEQPGSSLAQPNRWFRLTHLGMSFNNFYDTMLNRETGIQFIANPRPGRPDAPRQRGVFIRLEEAEELIKQTD